MDGLKQVIEKFIIQCGRVIIREIYRAYDDS